MSFIFQFIGIATCVLIATRVGVWLLRTFMLKSSALKRAAPSGHENWAVVTGCTSGIGEGFAEELASRGLNVVLVSRSIGKLQETQKRIESKFKVKSKVVAIDFCNESASEYMPRLSETLRSIGGGNISVLVNNVGVNYHEVPNKFLEVTEGEQQDMVRVNVEATMNVTRVVLPTMVQQKRGIVVNLGSYVSAFPCPLMAVYSGSKAFIEAWSAALSNEYKSSGIDIVAISPMYVVSQMSGFKRPSLTACSQRRIAADTIDSLGTVLTPPTYSPYFMHAVLMFAQSLIPQKILLGLQHSTLLGVRKRINKSHLIFYTI